MMFARLRLLVAALAFFGWMAWLAVAVWNKDTVQILSTAQLTEATHLVVGQVTTNESGDALPQVKVLKVIRVPAGQSIGDEIEIDRLDKAVTPREINGSRRIGAGEYLLPLVKTPTGYQLAGLPRSPGFEGAILDQPIVYPWTENVRIQLRTLGIWDGN